jgi:hypothetical protein
MAHALIIGGTGMLREATAHLCKTYKAVSVIGRNRHRLYSLIRETEHYKGNILPVVLDYTNESALLPAVKEAITNYGNISLAAAWVHSTAPGAPFRVAELISSYGREFRFFHILGCEHKDPSADNKEKDAEFKSLPFIKYRKIILGFMMENESSRWLTHEEISAGTVKAIENDMEEYIIGTVTPWDKHPQF